MKPLDQNQIPFILFAHVLVTSVCIRSPFLKYTHPKQVFSLMLVRVIYHITSVICVICAHVCMCMHTHAHAQMK